MKKCYICLQDKPDNNIALEGILAAAAPIPVLSSVARWAIAPEFVNPQVTQ